MLAYTSRPYSEAMAMSPAVTYTPYATSFKEQTGDIITFVQFEEGNILTKTLNDVESGDESNDDSIVPPLLSVEESIFLDYADDSYDKPMSTEMLEDIFDRSQTHPNVNRREARYKISDRIRQKQLEWKGA